MARIKFAEGVTKLRKSANGYTFQNTSRFSSMRAVAQIKHERQPYQRDKINNFMYFTRLWRTLPGNVRDNWNAWAVFLPQRTKFAEAKFLSGYQCYLRRNYYQQLFLGIGSGLMDSPALVEYEPDFPFTVIAMVGGRLLVDFTFVRSDSTIEVHLFVSGLSSDAVNYNGNNYRFIRSCLSFDQTMDITDLYLSQFVKLPAVSDVLFASIVCAGIDNGQLWFHEQVKRVVSSVVPDRRQYVYTYYCTPSLADVWRFEWRVPYWDDIYSLVAALGGYTGSSDKLRAKGLRFWDAPNDSALDSLGMAFKGTGGINFESGYWENIKYSGQFQMFHLASVDTCYNFYMDHLSADANVSIYRTNDGFPVRLCNPNTLLPEGAAGVYTGNDGKQYPTKVINGVEWMLTDLQETKDFNGINLMFVAEGAAWSALNYYDSAYCRKNIFDI